MKQNKRRFTDSEKSTILVDYYASGISMNAMAKKYSIRTCTFSYWVKTHPIDSVLLSLPQESMEDVMAKMKSKETDDEIARLQARVKALEKALAFSRLEIQARDMLIDIAEKQEKIQIRKKSGVK
ncbi:MAG: transposase [Paludibacter sp.]|nr:transposase [Paludibacter sp.]